MINYGIRQGNLEVIPLIGLNSPNIFYLLQFYVDKTSDLQTAAYVSAYAINVQRISGLVSNGNQNRLNKFVHEYRSFLNGL